MAAADLVIAVHPPFAGLVDWRRVTRSRGRWCLVTSAESRAELQRAGVLGAFAEVSVLESFDEDRLGDEVARLLCDARENARLVTMLEPLQLPLARLRDRFGVPGPGEGAVLPFVDKVVMKRSMRGVDDLLPRFVPHDPEAFARHPQAWVERVVAELGLPVFAKPRAENSCTGTARLDTRQAVAAFCGRATTDHQLEEMIDGDVYHLDAVLVGGELRWFGAGRYVCPPYATLAGRPLAGIAIGPSQPQFDELRALKQRLLRAFPSVPDGCTHFEAIRRPDGSWTFLEAAARTPGWRIPEAHRIHRGVDLRAIHYQLQAGAEPKLDERPGPAAGWYTPLKTAPGRIARLHEPPFRSPHEHTWSPDWLERTDAVHANTLADHLGTAVLWNKSWDAVWDDLNALDDYAPYTLACEEPGSDRGGPHTFASATTHLEAPV